MSAILLFMQARLTRHFRNVHNNTMRCWKTIDVVVNNKSDESSRDNCLVVSHVVLIYISWSMQFFLNLKDGEKLEKKWFSSTINQHPCEWAAWPWMSCWSEQSPVVPPDQKAVCGLLIWWQNRALLVTSSSPCSKPNIKVNEGNHGKILNFLTISRILILHHWYLFQTFGLELPIKIFMGLYSLPGLTLDTLDDLDDGVIRSVLILATLPPVCCWFNTALSPVTPTTFL